MSNLNVALKRLEDRFNYDNLINFNHKYPILDLENINKLTDILYDNEIGYEMYEDDEEVYMKIYGKDFGHCMHKEIIFKYTERKMEFLYL